MGYYGRFCVILALCAVLWTECAKGDAGAGAYSSSYVSDSSSQQHYNTPGTAYAAPGSNSYQAPSGPASSSSSSGYPAPASGYGGYPSPPSSGYGTPAPSPPPQPPSGYGAPAGGYGSPAPPPPSYGVPDSGYPAPSPAPAYGAPDDGYAAPSPPPSYGAPDAGYGYGTPAPPPPAAGYGPPAPSTPHTITKKTWKFKFFAAIAAIKLMLLYLLYVLYKIVYFGTVPQAASASKPVCDKDKLIREQEDARAVLTVTDRFINQLMAGDFDVNKLFKGYME